jgi:hypothetical protein
MRLTPKTEDWREQAVCSKLDTEIFFPHKNTHTSVQNAFSYCKQCPVKIECLHVAVVYSYDGIWGQSTMGQRMYVLKEYFDNNNSNFTIEDAKKMYSQINNISVTIRPHRRRKIES